MASLSFSSLCLNRSPTQPKSLHFSFKLPSVVRAKAWPCLRSGSVVCRASPVVIPNLQADDFRHPLDLQNTRRLMAIPGLSEIESILRGHMARGTDDSILNEALMVTPSQYPKLHKLMAEAAEMLNVEAPLLFVQHNPEANAYTVAENDEPYVVVHSGLMDLLTLEELQAVFAHELGHLKCDHCFWLTYAALFVNGVKAVFAHDHELGDLKRDHGVGWLISQSLEEELVCWSQSAELSCDRAALLVAGDPMVVVSVLMKLAGGCTSMMEELNVEAYMKQARDYHEGASSSRSDKEIRVPLESQLDHPGFLVRAAEIDIWSRSEEYNTLKLN